MEIPIRLILSEGNRNDIKYADKLIENIPIRQFLQIRVMMLIGLEV